MWRGSRIFRRAGISVDGSKPKIEKGETMETQATEVTVRIVELEPGQHISRRVIGEVSRETVTVEAKLCNTGTIYGGYTTDLRSIEGQLRTAGLLPYLSNENHEYRLSVTAVGQGRLRQSS